MLRFGGGGHRAVGTCQFSGEDMERQIPLLIGELLRG